MGTRHTDAMLRFVRRWFDERTVTNVFEPLLADHQREWLDAPLPRRSWITLRTAIALLTTVVSMAPRALLLTPTPPSMTRRIVARMILFMSVVTGLMLIPFLIDLANSPFVNASTFPPRRFAEIMFWLLPSAMLPAFPFAMGFIVDGVRRSRTPTPAERVAFFRAAMFAVVVMIVCHGWVVPAANQQFRLTVMADADRPPARGARELTTPQLFQTPWLARADPQGRRVAVQREIHSRASFALLPIVLMWLRWRALTHPSPQWLLPSWLAATVTIGGFSFLRGNDASIESMLGLEAGAAAWVPLVVFLAIGWIRDRAAARTVISVLPDMTRWLAIAEWLCGAHARRTIFEPLVADWRHEIKKAQDAGPWRVARVFGSGATAYVASLAGSMMMGGWLPTPRAAASATLAFGLAAGVSKLIVLGLSYAWRPEVDLRSIQTQAFLLFSAVLIVPPAFLPALFVMRRDPRSNLRHAILTIALAAAGTAALVVLTSETAINSYFSTFEAGEREYARNLANDRAGRYQYPGTAVRQLRGEMTVEQRRESFERFEAWRAEQIATQPPRPVTWRGIAVRYQPVALAVLFAMMGWTLAGLAAPTLRRAMLWWGLMAMAMLTLSATPGLFMRIAVNRVPHWATVPIFVAMTAVLVIASWRHHRTPDSAPTPSTSYPTAPTDAGAHR